MYLKVLLYAGPPSKSNAGYRYLPSPCRGRHAPRHNLLPSSRLRCTDLTDMEVSTARGPTRPPSALSHTAFCLVCRSSRLNDSRRAAAAPFLFSDAFHQPQGIGRGEREHGGLWPSLHCMLRRLITRQPRPRTPVNCACMRYTLTFRRIYDFRCFTTQNPNGLLQCASARAA